MNVCWMHRVERTATRTITIGRAMAVEYTVNAAVVMVVENAVAEEEDVALVSVVEEDEAVVIK